ncbi:alpha/beta hydrolase [Burkholderia sp. FERM BP-3421]|jgi:alpha/beta superfamily hydrolase|uniref:serine aminopeptidase domain-containing protein n=1 Tax=Burkholderia sp. FERM BP-3421 TaxID=1494466 RepID=UPI002362CE09|nr:alpha/beta hydrolase [Burkholderia sp. FERM BP-3421]WDD95308.1 alpha/beta hydrolase [Burkholderia sp. FERM BP-3421]
MRPIQFDACLGWLHAGRTTHGVVLCEPLGHEALWTHKLVRALAERLAARGLWVLRFHYPSSGDSAGDDLAPGRFARSLASVRAAVRALRLYGGVDHVTLAGTRAGAAFALLAAASPESDAPPIDAFVALAPMVRGRAYLRELAMVQQRWLDSAPPTVRAGQRDEPGLNILGHRYPADLVDALKGVDLVDAVARASTLPHAALLVDTEYGASPALRDALRARGVPVDELGLDGWAGALQEGARSRLPLRALDALAGWIARDLGTSPARAAPSIPAEAPLACTADGVAEQLVRIGPARLVGMLCEPAEPTAVRTDVPLLLIPNTAANPRSGDGRIAVRLARALARQGIASLRIDIDGVGDSGARAPDDQSVVLYSERTIADVATAADWFAARGCRPVVAFAVCSGAYAALHAAAQSTSLAGVIAINLPRFIWPRGMTLADALRQQTNSARGYLASVRDWRKWRQLLRERRDLRPIIGALRRLALARVRVPVARLAERIGVEPSRDTPRGLLRALARRGVRTWFVYGEYDPGVDELRRHFGAPATAFRRAPLADVRLIRELDHSVYGSAAADRVIEFCIETLTGWSRLAAGSAAPAQPAVGEQRRASRPASA